jgi:hypothetical protein
LKVPNNAELKERKEGGSSNIERIAPFFVSSLGIIRELEEGQ